MWVYGKPAGFCYIIYMLAYFHFSLIWIDLCIILFIDNVWTECGSENNQSHQIKQITQIKQIKQHLMIYFTKQLLTNVNILFKIKCIIYFKLLLVSDRIRQLVMSGERPSIDSIPRDVQELIRTQACWHQQPNQRPSFSDNWRLTCYIDYTTNIILYIVIIKYYWTVYMVKMVCDV